MKTAVALSLIPIVCGCANQALPVSALDRESTDRHRDAFHSPPAIAEFQLTGETPLPSACEPAPTIDGVGAACFAAENPPPPAIIELIEQSMRDGLRYYQVGRWTPGNQGDPRVVLWSFVPDGMVIPDTGPGDNCGAGPSQLFSVMNSQFVSQAQWIAEIQAVFDRWEELTGLDFERVTCGSNPFDDGLPWGSPGAPFDPPCRGRGDIRIGMKCIDGGGGILARSWFPNLGDIVMDRAENWAVGYPSGPFTYMRHILSHEVGHAIGIDHVCPTDQTKLMEPFVSLSTTISGPEHDDLRAGQRHYGDIYEPNNFAAQAAPLGLLNPNTAINVGDVPAPPIAYGSTASIDADGEEDWFSFSVASPTTVTFTLEPIGTNYDNSQEVNGSCTSGHLTDSLAIANLSLQVLDGNLVPLATENSGGAGGIREIYSLPLGGPANYYIRVFEDNAPAETQLYHLAIRRQPCIELVSIFTNTNEFPAECEDTFCNNQEARSSVGQLPAGTDQLRTRYAEVVAVDRACPINDLSLNAVTDYSITFKTNKAPGEPWLLLVDQYRKGDITLHDHGSCSEATLFPLTGIVNGASLLEGTLNIPTSIFRNNCGPNNEHEAFDATQHAQAARGYVAGTGPGPFELRFTWTVDVLSEASNTLGGDEAAVRLGLSTTSCSGPVAAGEYPGHFSRTDTDDGHFVTITCVDCIDAGYCADFDQPSSVPGDPLEGYTTQGAALSVFNPYLGGASTGQAGDGYIRLEDADGGPGDLTLVAPEALHGNWSCFCGSLEFDVRVFSDGCPGTTFHPSIRLTRNDGLTSPSGCSNVSATFISNASVTASMGWVHIVIPIPPGIPPLASAHGTWSLSGAGACPAACSDWDWVIENVTDVTFPGEFTACPDILGYDNICFHDNPHCVPPAPGLVGWWPFDERLLPLRDIAGQVATSPKPSGLLGHWPDVANAVGPVPDYGVVEGGLSFNGTSHYVEVAASGRHTFVDVDFTIDAWIKTSQQTGVQPIVDQRTILIGSPPNNVVGYRLFLENGRLACTLADLQFAGQTDYHSVNPMIADGCWHHVAVTVKRYNPGALINLFVDGQVIAQFSPLGKSDRILNGAAKLLIGGGHPIGGPMTYFRGRIDEVELFRRALTTQEIKDLYEAGCAGKCREFCYVGTYQYLFGPGGTGAGRIRLTICNGTGSPQKYNWSMGNMPISPPDCSVTGLAFSPSASTAPITVQPGECIGIDVDVTLPSGMTNVDLACYCATITNVTDASHSRMLHSCCGALRQCDIVMCPGGGTGTNWNLAVAQFSQGFGGGGLPLQLDFPISGTAGTVPYRLTSQAHDHAGPPIISLNGLSAGASVEGFIDVPGTISVTARYVEFQRFVPQEVTLWLDLDNDGQFEPALSQGLLCESSPGDCNSGTQVISNGAASDGSLQIRTDAFGSFQNILSQPDDGDMFDPPGANAGQPTFSSGLFLFVAGTYRELLSDACAWQNSDLTQPPPGDPSLYFEADESLTRLVTDCCLLSDTNGDGTNDTTSSAFSVTGLDVNLEFQLTQFVSEPNVDGAAYLRQDYQITNNGATPLTVTLVRSYDGDLPWSGSPPHSDDWVGAAQRDGNWYVFEREPSSNRLAVTLSSPTPPDAYFGGKTGIDPDGPGGSAQFGFGTSNALWDAFGIPIGWRNFVAGVGYGTPGESGSQPAGSTDPYDAFCGLQFDLTLQPGENRTLTLVHSYGSAQPLFPPGAPACPGDLDGDGTVSLPDLAVLLSHFGSAGGPNDGDIDNDGDVDLSDLANLLANFGSSC
jgi:hypothetical protein